MTTKPNRLGISKPKILEILDILECESLIKKIKDDNEVVIDTVESYLEQIKTYERQYRKIDFLNGESDNIDEYL